MNKLSHYLRACLAFVLVFSSCKKNAPEDQQDNLYQFREYISYHTQGVQSIAEPIVIGLTQSLEQFEIDQEVPSEYLEIRPKVAGRLVVENSNTMVFEPAEFLSPNQEYQVNLNLGKLYDGVDKAFKNYRFSFATIPPAFKVDLSSLQSYDRNWQYLEGRLSAADILPKDKVNGLINAQLGEKGLKINWRLSDNDQSSYDFIIDSIPRGNQSQDLSIQWNGAAVGAESKGQSSFPIPGLKEFTVINARASSSPNAMLLINFSEPLNEGQELRGLVQIGNQKNLRYEIEGNVLRVYPSNRVMGEARVKVNPGLQSIYGAKLSKSFSEVLAFEQLKPAVRLISKGTILPNAQNTPFYFETVNLNAIEVRVIKVFQDNMLQFLQDQDLGISYRSDLRRVGRRVAYKLIDLRENGQTNTSYWKAHALDLSDMMEADPGALYRVEFSFKKEHSAYGCVTGDDEVASTDAEFEYQAAVPYDENAGQDPDEARREERYWDNELYNWRQYRYNWRERNNPCHEAYYNNDRIVFTNLMGSDLGLIAKKGKNKSFHFIVTDLLTAKPLRGAQVKLYNFQQQLLSTLTTDRNGLAVFDAERGVAFAVAELNNMFAYAKLSDGNALSMSKFDISGEQLQEGLQGFSYTERGVHRPGETIHLTFVLDDSGNPLPKNHPVELEVTDARGKLAERIILKSQPLEVGNGLFAKKEGNFYYFPIQTSEDAPTGSWYARIRVGGAQFGKSLKVATVKPNRLKVNLSFEDEILEGNKAITGQLQGSWLHGAPARNLKYEIQSTLRLKRNPFPQHRGFEFTDPVRKFYEVQATFSKGSLDANGIKPLKETLSVSKKSPGMLEATFTTKLLEGGGDFSLDVMSQPLSPYSHFIGLKSPEAQRYGSFFTDQNNRFELLSVNAQGKINGNRTVEVQVYKIEWRWWWNRGYDNLSRYENSTYHRPFKTFNVRTDAQGKASFDLNVPEDESGRFLIRITDAQSGHATGRIAYFYRDWWKRAGTQDAESAKMLIFSADKDRYTTGETARITFPSDQGGRALISIENGSEVLQTMWVNTTAGETVADIAISPEMAPNVYFTLSLLQPHASRKNDLPLRLYGVIPVMVDDPATQLAPKIQLAEELKPEESFTVKVSEENKKAMTYTLAVVDEGLLDLTRFATPEIHKAFYARQALGVKTFDIFDDVMGAYSLSVDNIYAVGGGEAADGGKNRKAQRFKPMVKYIGPFDLKAGQTASHTINMPNYIGSVRTMVIAGNAKKAYGSAETTTPVRKPLMVLSSVPRKLSPGEKVTVPVTVFAMDKKVKNVSVKVNGGQGLKPLGATTKSIQFSQLGDQIVNFDFEVLPNSDRTTIAVEVSGAGEKASDKTEVGIFNPNPVVRTQKTYTLSGNESRSINFEPFGTPGTRAASMEFSTLPPMDLNGRLDYLIRYPHGCVEQTTSAAFPQLFLGDIMDLTYERKRDIESNVKKAIKRLGSYQAPDGGLSYWPGGSQADDWGTSYAGHFMLEAKQKGYSLPLSFYSNWLGYQKKAARSWSAAQNSGSAQAQAYRLYTLALAGQADLSAMNRLRETPKLPNDAKWRLAAAYALIGKKGAAEKLMGTANLNFTPSRYDYYTYGSPFRNRAMALETLVILGDQRQREISLSLARSLSSQGWYSTQETAYALLALTKMVQKNGGKSIAVQLNQNNKNEEIKTQQALASRPLYAQGDALTVGVENKQDNVVYATLTQSGKLALGREISSERNLRVKVRFFDGSGEEIDVSQLRQGSEITAQIRVTNLSSEYVTQLALTQIFPSGWEIVNTSFTGLGQQGTQSANYTDIRDDRVGYYFNLGSRKSKTFRIQLNASYLGEYYLPGAQAEAMYNDDFLARNKGQWVKIVQ